MKPSTIAIHAALAAVASSAAVELDKRASPLHVSLECIANSTIKAIVTNNGDTDLNIFTPNSFLDTAAIEKAEVYSADARVAFDGIRQRLSTTNLDSDSFQNIPAGGSIEAIWDTAEMHDLSAGGDFDVLTQGALPYAAANSTDIIGAVPYRSNRITANVAPAHALSVRRGFFTKIEEMKKRASLMQCSGEKKAATDTAMQNCKTLSLAAAEAARAGNPAFTKFFKQADASEVKRVFTAVADECGASSVSNVDYYCDQDAVTAQKAMGGCGTNVLAYTAPSLSIVVNCNLYYTFLPNLTSACYNQDQATTTLHEFTHLYEIKGTGDLAYGYLAAIHLTSSQALRNADSYALFANAVANDCVDSGSGTAAPSGTATTLISTAVETVSTTLTTVHYGYGEATTTTAGAFPN